MFIECIVLFFCIILVFRVICFVLKVVICCFVFFRFWIKDLIIVCVVDSLVVIKFIVLDLRVIFIFILWCFFCKVEMVDF